MQQYSFYIVPVVQCNQPIFTFSNAFPQPNTAYIAANNVRDPHNFATNQPLLQSAPQSTRKQQTSAILPSSNSARTPRRDEDLFQPDVPKQVLNKNLVLDHNVYKYPKKNAQSNLINQVVSYISIQSKSINPVFTIFKGNADKTELFYSLMRQVKRQNKKYINRGYLKDLLVIQKSHIIHGILQKNKIEPLLTLEELQSALRRIVFHFLIQKSALTVLTSSKLDRFSMKEHLQRRREIVEYLRYHLKNVGEEEHSQS